VSTLAPDSTNFLLVRAQLMAIVAVERLLAGQKGLGDGRK
jgi:hypothetical protein